MHSLRTDSQFFRDALERVGKADDGRASRAPAPVGAGREAEPNGVGKAFPFDCREPEPTRVIGRLVALNGTQGVISCPLRTDEDEWSIGHLITILHRNSRLVGTVCEVSTDDGRWSENEANSARVTIELNGEIIDELRRRAFFPSRRAFISFAGRARASHTRRRSPSHLHVSRPARRRNRPVEPKRGYSRGDRRGRIDPASLRPLRVRQASARRLRSVCC